MSLNLIANDFKDALDGNIGFSILNYWDNNRKVQVKEVASSSLSYPQYLVYNLLRQRDVLEAMISRSSGDDLIGFVWASDWVFRECFDFPLADPIERFTFNWHPQSELLKGSVDKESACFLKLLYDLTEVCDPKFQIPCWVSGLPYPSNERLFQDFLFIADIRSCSEVSLEQFSIAQKVM